MFVLDFTGVKAITIPEGSVKKITTNGVVLWEKVTSRIPSEYQEVEWIGTTGTQYISFNETPDNVNEMIFTVAFTEWVGSYICGASYSTSLFFLGARMSRSAQALDFYGCTMSTYKRSSKLSLNTIYEIHLKNNFSNSLNDFVILQNGNTLWSANSPIENTAATISPYGIGYNGIYDAGKNVGLKGKIYAYQHKRNDIIVREFIPCYRKSDNVIGMYDIVSKTFFTNAGTGSFTKGANI